MEIINTISDILLAEDKEPDWLIPGLMLQGTLNCIGGEPGAGKSYVSYTLTLAIASGVPALSGIVPALEPRRVVYFDDENSQQDRDKYIKRSYTGLKHYGKFPSIELLHENFWPAHFKLGGPDWIERAEEYVEYVQPNVIVFDTAASCFNTEDENDNAEAAIQIKAIRRLMALCSPTATAIVLKHAKIRTEKGGKRTMRGAKNWHGMSDQVMFQVKAPGRPKRDGLSLTRLIPDKTRAYGLSRTIYITPSYTDEAKSGLKLAGSYDADGEHEAAEREDEGKGEDE